MPSKLLAKAERHAIQVAPHHRRMTHFFAERIEGPQSMMTAVSRLKHYARAMRPSFRKGTQVEQDLGLARAAWMNAMSRYSDQPGFVNFEKAFGEIPLLQEEHVAGCQLLCSRETLIEKMKKGGKVAEIGVQAGNFSDCILKKNSPNELHLFDISLTHYGIADRFVRQIEEGTVSLHEGDSSTELAKLPDNYFDFIYIDGDHSYEGVSRDIAVAKSKVTDDGYLIFNDYTFWSPAECMMYGVVQAVNELCLETGSKLEYFALGYAMYCDVAVRKPR